MMIIYKVNETFYTNYDQAYLNAEKLGVKVEDVYVVESEEPEVEIHGDTLKVSFDNGDKFELEIEFEDVLEDCSDDPEDARTLICKEIEQIDFIFEPYKHTLELNKSKITDELKREIEYYAERIKDKF
jgi:hypothetical protein